MFSNRSNIFYIALLILAWGIMLCIANPSGNFPLNDDWMYSRPVSYLIRDHIYKVTDEYSPVLVAQVFWGALFCFPFGFSFMTLRISVIVLGILSSIALYFLLNRLSGNKLFSFCCFLLILCNPLFFCLSNSFMTDIPFLSFSLLSFLFFFKALERPNLLLTIIATTIAIFATLTRQFGMVIPISFAITAIVLRKQGIVIRTFYILPVIIIGWLLHYTMDLLRSKGFYPYGGTEIGTLLLAPALFHQVIERCGIVLSYAGFFLSPLLILLQNPFNGLSKRRKISVNIFILFFIPMLITAWPLLPTGNYINTAGMGPMTVKNGTQTLTDFPETLLTVLHGIAFTGALFLLANLGKVITDIISSFRAGSMDMFLRRKLFLLLCVLGYGFLVALPDFFFDRYITYFFPLLLMIIVPRAENMVKPPVSAITFSGVMALVFMIFGVLATHDYFAWNRVRWQAVGYLQDELKISPHKMDGGYEYNGWAIGIWYPAVPGKSWWYVDDDEYTISFDKEEGYSILKEYPVKRYLPAAEDKMYILHRNPK